MSILDRIIPRLGQRFGVLAESNTSQLTVVAHNTDVAVGDLFLLPSDRGQERMYVFRTSQYANILNRSLDMSDVARAKLTMPDSYLSEDLSDEKLIELKGMVLGYAQWDSAENQWRFFRPRRLPQHLSDVFHVHPNNADSAEIVRTLMQSQLGTSGLYIGDLLAGEHALTNVPVYLPPYALSHHIGIFGRTGSGKSNLMMVLLRSILQHNQAVVTNEANGPAISILAIDPHDEFRRWHAASGGANGIQGIVNRYSAEQQAQLVAPFYYLTARRGNHQPLERRVYLSRADVTPDDLFSVMAFSEQQIAFANQFYALHGENWIGRLLLNDIEVGDDGTQYLPGTIAAVQRRVGFLRVGQTTLFTPFDPEFGRNYTTTLPDILCALEQGRVIIVDTTLMSELEQFLLNTVVARVLFALRKALRSAENAADLPNAIRTALGNNERDGTVGMQSLADEMIDRLEHGVLPYLENGEISAPDQLPYVNIVIEEAPSVLNPQRMRFGSIFRDISRQGRKFGIGLTVVSQQVSEIDRGVLTQLNTELNMSLGNEFERRETIRNASTDLHGFERELQVMSQGQLLVTSSFKDIPVPVQVPEYSRPINEG